MCGSIMLNNMCGNTPRAAMHARGNESHFILTILTTKHAHLMLSLRICCFAATRRSAASLAARCASSVAARASAAARAASAAAAALQQQHNTSLC
jgi:hypothetical protein